MSNEEFHSLSPIDDSVVWAGRESTTDEVNQVMSRAATAGRDFEDLPLQQRITIVQNYAKYLTDNRNQISDLISREVGKLPWDANGEVGASIAKAELSIRALTERRSERVADPGPPKRVVRYRPLGVTLVLGPFNFPLHLPGGQIIPALLSGNAVVMKPSEQATAVAQWMADAWKAAGLPDDVLQLIFGRVSPASAAIDSPHLGGVFLTGGRAAGQAIHRQLAGRYDVLLALELGGNNPIVVCGELPAEEVARVVSFSAFISAGQRCTCARRAIFVRGPQTDAQIRRLTEKTRQLCVGLPGDTPSPQMGPLIDVRAAEKLETTYQKLIELGCQSIVPFETDSRRANLVRPCIVEAKNLESESQNELGQTEWFGPLLVIEVVDSMRQAFERAADTSYGLSAALLGGDQALFETFVRKVGAGVVNWNAPTTGAAGALPFGGLGDSGNHRPAGFHAIDFCNDPIASLESEALPTKDPWDIAQ